MSEAKPSGGGRPEAGRSGQERGQDARKGNPVTVVFSVLLVLLGLAIIVRTLAAGGGPLAYGLLMGVLLMAAGVGRLMVERRR